MEELVLTDPVVKPAETTSKFKVIMLVLDHETIVTFPPPAETLPGLVMIKLKDDLGKYHTHQYTGQVAQDYIKFINTANFSTKSMHKRILERLSTDGVLPGTVTGTPDPPTP